MANWDLTEGLKNLRAQVNARFPHRDKKSDGTIGDSAHQAETSGHNPDDTKGSRPEWDGDTDANAEVRAWDMDSDLGEPGVTAKQVVDHLRSLPRLSSVIRYMIYNRQIYRSANLWRAEPYSGPSPHTEHIHFTGAYSQAADANTTFDYRLEEVGDTMSAADAQQGIAELFAQAALATSKDPKDLAKITAAGRSFRSSLDKVLDFGETAGPLADAVKDVAEQMAELKAQITALAAKVDDLAL